MKLLPAGQPFLSHGQVSNSVSSTDQVLLVTTTPGKMVLGAVLSGPQATPSPEIPSRNEEGKLPRAAGVGCEALYGLSESWMAMPVPVRLFPGLKAHLVPPV